MVRNFIFRKYIFLWLKIIFEIIEKSATGIHAFQYLIWHVKIKIPILFIIQYIYLTNNIPKRTKMGQNTDLNDLLLISLLWNFCWRPYILPTKNLYIVYSFQGRHYLLRFPFNMHIFSISFVFRLRRFSY